MFRLWQVLAYKQRFFPQKNYKLIILSLKSTNLKGAISKQNANKPSHSKTISSQNIISPVILNNFISSLKQVFLWLLHLCILQ